MRNVNQKWVELLEPFSGGYSNKISASELSKKTKIPQQTASRILNRVVKLNLISYVREGKNKLFYLDLERQTIKIILNLIENQKALQFQLKIKKISIIINEILKHCESLIVFGSYASEKFYSRSDLDLVIFGRYDKEKIKEIKHKQIIDINEHYISYKEFEKILKKRNPLAIEILQNHILFGNVSKIVNIFWRREYERR